MILYSLSLIFLTYIFHCNADSADSLNPKDNDCPRIRRPWHSLTTTERDLYISGLLELRNRGNGNPATDEFIAIASVHEDSFAPVTHKASSYLYWHGYLTYELESRIRNLGGKYKCFGMPYWDFTIESGREDHPFIFSTGLGGDGDPNDYYTVNQYSWQVTTAQYWVPFNCLAQNDKYPLCSLKRALKPTFPMPSAQDFGAGIIENPEFTQFAKWYASQYNPIHLFTHASIFTDGGSPVVTSYDPIWYLFHSMVQYHQAIWTDCNQYDLIDPNDLDGHPEAYKAYCVHGECISPNQFPKQWMGMELDSVMHFGGILKEKEWSYIHKNDLTVRKLYNLAKWGIIYDLGDGTGFYQKSGLKSYCKGKLNDKWFTLNEENNNNDKDDKDNKDDDDVEKELNVNVAIPSEATHIALRSFSNSIIIVIGLMITLIGLVLSCICKSKQKEGFNQEASFSYGTV